MNEFETDLEKPLKPLSEGMRKVARGHLDITLDEPAHEPFRSLVRDFNHMTESLSKNEALREGFVSNAAHEFKMPLSYIQGYATLLQDDELPAELRRSYVSNICDATRQLSAMVGDLLEISNLSRPSAQLETASFSLDEQLRHVMATFYPRIVSRQLDYDLDLETVSIVANEGLLADVWVNLISNAVKHTDAGGIIAVTLEKRGQLAVVKVRDTGCGMTESQVEHAFDRFYQGESPHNGEGTGLGLAIAKAIVEKHDGTVSVHSEPGRGAEFTVTVPVAPTGA